MIDLLPVLAGETAKVVAGAVVGRVDKGAAQLFRVLRTKFGSVPPDSADLRGRVLIECERDPEFQAELTAALALLNVGGHRAHAVEGIEDFRNQIEHLRTPPESGTKLICGAPGSGKTELARQLMGLVRERFPAGWIELDLAQYRSGDALDLAVVKRETLRRLGIPDKQLMVDDAGLDEQFASVLTTRMFGIILDNVRSARDLEPFRAYRLNLVLATTSTLTRDLAALDPTPIVLRGLDPDGAREMLGDYCGAVRLDEEPQAVQALLTASDRLPAPIREIGLTLARRAGEPQPVAGLLADYRRTGIVDAEGVLKDALVRTFAALPAATAQAAALLAGFPGIWFTRPVAAEFLGDSAAFDAVVDAQLTEQQDGWYRLTTLVRQYALQLPADRDAAFSRLLHHVRDQVVAADLAGDERGRAGRLREYDVPSGVAWSSHEDRFSWLGRHLGLITELVRSAYWRGCHEEVCQLAGGIEVLVNQRWLWREYAEISDWAVQSAAALHARDENGRAALLARTLSMRAKARYLARLFEPAAADLERAWELTDDETIPLWRRERLRSSVAEFRARFFEERADTLGAAQPVERPRLLGQAETWLRMAVETDERLSHGYALAIHLRMLALVLVKEGRPDEAIAAANSAFPHAMGRNLSRLDMVVARAYLAMGDTAQARQYWRRADEQLRASGADQYQWELREMDARLLAAEKHQGAARTAWGALINEAFAVGHPRAAEYLSEYESSR